MNHFPLTSGNIINTKRHFPWRMSHHIATQYMWPLCGTVACFAMVSLLLAVFDSLPDFTGRGVPVHAMLLYFAAGMPKTLLTILPFSSLLAICFMTMILGKNNELTAIRSAGVSLLTAAAPIMFIALLLCCLYAALAEAVEPAAQRYIAYVNSHYLEEHGSGPNHTGPLAYYNARYHRDWFFADFAAEGQSRGISVRSIDKLGRTTEIITAATAEYLYGERSWCFTNGETQTFAFRAEDGSPLPQPKATFGALVRPYHEKPRDIFLQSQSYEELPLIGLLRVNRRHDAISPRSARLVRTMLAWRIFSPLSPLIATLLGFSLTLSTGRKSAIRGFVLAVALFMAYHLFAQFALLLGKNGAFPPLLAGSLPTLAALAGAFFLACRRQ